MNDPLLQSVQLILHVAQGLAIGQNDGFQKAVYEVVHRALTHDASTLLDAGAHSLKAVLNFLLHRNNVVLGQDEGYVFQLHPGSLAFDNALGGQEQGLRIFLHQGALFGIDGVHHHVWIEPKCLAPLQPSGLLRITPKIEPMDAAHRTAIQKVRRA